MTDVERKPWMSRPVCGAKTKSGRPCQRPAGEGGDILGYGPCRLHFGRTDPARRSAARQAARAEAVALGGQMDLEPHEAIQWCVNVTVAEVLFFDRKIAELGGDDLAGQATVEVTKTGGKDGETFETRTLPPALNIWVNARADSIDRLARFSKMAADMDTSERRTQLEEGKAERVVEVLRLVVDGLGLNPAQRALLPGLYERHLPRLDDVVVPAPKALIAGGRR